MFKKISVAISLILLSCLTFAHATEKPSWMLLDAEKWNIPTGRERLFNFYVKHDQCTPLLKLAKKMPVNDADAATIRKDIVHCNAKLSDYYYSNKQYAKALQYTLPLAKSNDPDLAEASTVRTKHIYSHLIKESVKQKDYKSLVKYARQILVFPRYRGTAENLLGDAYNEGKGVKLDKVKALQWYKKAAKDGSTEAMMILADTYANVTDKSRVNASEKKMMYWLRQAASHGNAQAKQLLKQITG